MCLLDCCVSLLSWYIVLLVRSSTMYTHHVNIPGNDKADGVSKFALSLPITNMRFPASDLAPCVSKWKEWQDIWDACQGNKLYAIYPNVGGYQYKSSLSRRNVKNLLSLSLSLAVKKLLTHTLNSPCCLLYSTFLGKVSIVSNGTTRYFFRGYAESPRMCYICKPSLSSLWPISLRRKIHASCMLPSQLTLISRKHMWLSQTAWMITDVNAFLFVYESSSCRAELYALLLAIDVVRRSKEKNFVIFTDSMSSLQSIYGFNLDIPMTL